MNIFALNKQLFIDGSRDSYKWFWFWKRSKPVVWNCCSLHFLFQIFNIVEKCWLYRKDKHGLYRYNPIILLLLNNNCVHYKKILWEVIVSQMIKPSRWVFLFLLFFLPPSLQWPSSAASSCWSCLFRSCSITSPRRWASPAYSTLSEISFQRLGVSFFPFCTLRKVLGNKFGSRFCTRKSN